MATKVEVTIQDSLAFYNDAIGDYAWSQNNTPTNTYVIAVPDAWIQGGALAQAHLEDVYRWLYGATWRSGNDDGSKYVVLSASSRVLSADDPRPAKITLA